MHQIVFKNIGLDVVGSSIDRNISLLDFLCQNMFYLLKKGLFLDGKNGLTLKYYYPILELLTVLDGSGISEVIITFTSTYCIT